MNNSGMVAGIGTHHGLPAMFRFEPSTAAVAPVAAPGSGIRFAAYPNPGGGRIAFGGSVPGGEAAKARITIVDLSGRHVAVVQAPMSAGMFVANWDGFQDDGTRLPAGVYFAKLEAGAASSRTTLALSR